jgi:hypothetical protein
VVRMRTPEPDEQLKDELTAALARPGASWVSPPRAGGTDRGEGDGLAVGPTADAGRHMAGSGHHPPRSVLRGRRARLAPGAGAAHPGLSHRLRRVDGCPIP